MSGPKIRAAVCDLNGVWRGKLMPFDQLEKVQQGKMRMPFSTPTVDIWGHDIIGSNLVYKTGDADGVCACTGRGPLGENWLANGSVFMPVWMTKDSGAASMVDPRRILAHVTRQLSALGLRPVMALELEFYLVDASNGQPVAPKSPVTGKAMEGDSILSLQDLDDFDSFFADVYRACADYGIPADAAISEGGAGQFEINLLHIDDVLRAADNAVFFKRIIKGVARKHGFSASFMAKPYLKQAGSGLHVHFSILDNDGCNIFDDGGKSGSETLGHVVAGLMDVMAETTLIFAPHLNSYRRLKPGSHAPAGIGWGYENRTAALRIPGGAPAARRIEHRLSGADANPYLLLAAVLTGVLHGLKHRKAPPEPINGNAHAAGLQHLPATWSSALRLFEASSIIPEFMSPLFHRMFADIKRQEMQVFAGRMSDFEVATYLETI